MEQDYDQTQSLPSLEAEHAHYDTYELESETGRQDSPTLYERRVTTRSFTAPVIRAR